MPDISESLYHFHFRTMSSGNMPLKKNTPDICSVRTPLTSAATNGWWYLQAIVDTFGSSAFGTLYASKRQEPAVDILNDRALLFFQARD